MFFHITWMNSIMFQLILINVFLIFSFILWHSNIEYLYLTHFLKCKKISSVNLIKYVFGWFHFWYHNLRIAWFWLIRWFWFVWLRFIWFWFINNCFFISLSVHWFMVAIMMFVGWTMVVVVIHFPVTIIWIAPLEQNVVIILLLILLLFER